MSTRSGFLVCVSEPEMQDRGIYEWVTMPENHNGERTVERTFAVSQAVVFPTLLAAIRIAKSPIIAGTVYSASVTVDGSGVTVLEDLTRVWPVANLVDSIGAIERDQG